MAKVKKENMIDVIIPAHEKDISSLELCIAKVKKNVSGVQNVYVISKKKLTDSAIWFPESELPFSLRNVADKIGSHWRTAWYFADLLEGCASAIVDGPSPYTLILDADTIFLRPVSLIEDGKVLLNSSPTDGTYPYYEYVTGIIPELKQQNPMSGVTHWVLQDKFIVQEMIAQIEFHHGKEFWEAALDVTCEDYECLVDNNHETCPGKMANFELYFTYALQYFPDRVKVRNQNSILAYKETLGFDNYRRSVLSRTNTQGNIKILTGEEQEKINEMNFSSLAQALSYVSEVCASKGWDTITFQTHFWIGITDYRKLNDDYMKKSEGVSTIGFVKQIGKDIKLRTLSDADQLIIERLKEKASRGYQFLRTPRTASTVAMHMFKDLSSNIDFNLLGCSAFCDMPFSWGKAHHRILDFPKNIPPDSEEFLVAMRRAQTRAQRIINTKGQSDEQSWITTFNIRADQKLGYDKEKLTFQIIRNPFDWLTSMYRWNFMSTTNHVFQTLRVGGFDDYLDYYFRDKEMTWQEKVVHPFPWPMMKRCFFQGFNNEDECQVDVFIRFEYLQEGLTELFSLGGHDLPPIPEIAAKQTHWKHDNMFNDYKEKYYKKSSSVEKVGDAYSWDLKNFEYGYEGPKNKESILIYDGVDDDRAD